MFKKTGSLIPMGPTPCIWEWGVWHHMGVGCLTPLLTYLAGLPLNGCCLWRWFACVIQVEFFGDGLVFKIWIFIKVLKCIDNAIIIISYYVCNRCTHARLHTRKLLWRAHTSICVFNTGTKKWDKLILILLHSWTRSW